MGFLRIFLMGITLTSLLTIIFIPFGLIRGTGNGLRFSGISDWLTLGIITQNRIIKTFMIWKDLLDAGVYTNPVLYPAVAKGHEMLRTSFLATHTESHLAQAIEIFKKVGKNYDIGG